MLELPFHWIDDSLPTQYDDDARSIAQKQNKIGWKHVFYGRLSEEWILRQEIFLRNLHSRKKNDNGVKWATSLIVIIWEGIWEQWEARNHDRHGKEKEDKLRLQTEQAIRETEILYNMREIVPPHLQEYYYDNLQEHCEKEPTILGLRQWISTYHPLILHYNS